MVKGDNMITTMCITIADERNEKKQRVAKLHEIHQERVDSAKYSYDHQWIDAAECVRRMRCADQDFINGIDRIYGGKQ